MDLTSKLNQSSLDSTSPDKPQVDKSASVYGGLGLVALENCRRVSEILEYHSHYRGAGSYSRSKPRRKLRGKVSEKASCKLL